MSASIAEVPPIWRPDDGADPSPTELKARALAMEEAARSAAGITNSEGAGVSTGRNVIALATSQDFVRGYTTSGYSGGVSVIAGTGSNMQRDHASHNVRHYEDLDGPDELGRLAAERALKRPRPRASSPAATMPILFDPRIGGSLIGHPARRR
jgi:PmbA protein